MSKIFKYQTYLKIRLTAGVNIIGSTIQRIYYKKPGGTIGYWDATVESATLGILYYDIPENSILINEVGIWSFWIFIKFVDGREARGETITEEVFSNVL